MTTGARKPQLLGRRFFVEIDGIEHSSFQACSGLQADTEVFEYAEGGLNDHAHKLPGRIRYANITLRWGMTTERALWDWFQKTARGQVERKNLSIVLYDSQQAEVRRWNLREAYPVKWVGPTFSTENDSVAIEQLEIAHHGFEVQ